MGMFVSTIAALSTVYPDARDVLSPKSRKLQILRVLAKAPTIAAYTYRHSVGFPYVYPDNDLSYTEPQRPLRSRAHFMAAPTKKS
jgi:citrate synthase